MSSTFMPYEAVKDVVVVVKEKREGAIATELVDLGLEPQYLGCSAGRRGTPCTEFLCYDSRRDVLVSWLKTGRAENIYLSSVARAEYLKDILNHEVRNLGCLKYYENERAYVTARNGFFRGVFRVSMHDTLLGSENASFFYSLENFAPAIVTAGSPSKEDYVLRTTRFEQILEKCIEIGKSYGL